MFKKKAKNPDKMGLLNLFKWQSSQVSTACNVLILGYFNIFCTDTLLLDPLIMGILMVVSQVVSAVAGIFGGYIVRLGVLDVHPGHRRVHYAAQLQRRRLHDPRLPEREGPH